MGTVKTTAALEQSCLGSAQSCSSSPSLWCSARTWAHPWTMDLSKLIAMSWRICTMRLAEPEWHITAQTNLPQAMKRSVTHGCYNIWIPVRQPTVVSVSSSWLQRRICATLQTRPKNCATPYIVSTVSCSMPDRPFANDPTAGALAAGAGCKVVESGSVFSCVKVVLGYASSCIPCICDILGGGITSQLCENAIGY